MSLSPRLQAASVVALVHFCISLVVVCSVVAYALLVWFPDGLFRLTDGLGLFVVLMVVDILCGPGLTLVLFDPRKSSFKWRIDVALIVAIQLLALGYGVIQIAKTRPVYLAFEGDRFRLVQAMDVDMTRIEEAPSQLQSLPWSGPRPLGVLLSEPTAPDFLASVQESIRGFHPAFRPHRWVDYDSQSSRVLTSVKPVAELEGKSGTPTNVLLQAVDATGLGTDRLGYLPLVRDLNTSWIVLVDLQSAQPVGWAPIDGW